MLHAPFRFSASRTMPATHFSIMPRFHDTHFAGDCRFLVIAQAHHRRPSDKNRRMADRLGISLRYS